MSSGSYSAKQKSTAPPIRRKKTGLTNNSLRSTTKINNQGKNNMFNSLFKWIDRKIQNSREEYSCVVESTHADMGSYEDRMRLTIHFAHGGYVIESMAYDKHHDNHITQLHVFSTDSDLPTNIANIITTESFKRR